MNQNFFTENRLLFNTPPETPAPVASAPEVEPVAAETAPAITQERQETRSKFASLFASPIGGLSDIFAPNGSKLQKFAWEAVPTLAFAPYTMYNIGRMGVNLGYNTITSNPVKSVGKGIWNRVSRTLGTTMKLGVWDNVRRTWNSGILGLHGTKSLGIGTVSGIAGLGLGTVGAISAIPRIATAPLSKLTSWIPGIGYLTQGIDNVVKSTNDKIFNTAGEVLAYSKDDWKNVGSDINGIFKNTKSAIASTGIELTARLAIGTISPEWDAKVAPKLQGITNAVRDSKVISTIFGRKNIGDEYVV